MMVFCPETRSELKAAVGAWCEDEAAAKAQYGELSGWDVSKIDDMSQVPRCDRLKRKQIAFN